MPFEFLVFQMIPQLFVRIPIRGVLGQMENMQSALAVDEGNGLLGRMRWGLIHDNNQMAMFVVTQHLGKKVDYLCGGDAFFVEPKDKPPTTGDCRHGGNAASQSRYRLFWRLAQGAHVLASNAVSEMLASS